LSATVKRIAVIGGHADKGVLAGGGSSLVYPVGGNAVPGLKPTSWPGPVMYHPSSPMKAIQALAPGAKVEFASGEDRKDAAALASKADVALVFATQWNGESFDSPLTLENDQDALVQAVAAANPRTVVVLQNGGAIFMPWLDKVQGVLEAWYPGSSGGEAIANLLFGVVNPSGHLPISFPKDESQFARAALTETDAGKKTGEANYTEGATVGYKWFDAHQVAPLFPFGFGLSYTKFEYSDLQARVADGRAIVKFKLRNTGKREGRAVAQVYVSPAAGGWEAPKRLAAFQNLAMIRGQTAEIEMTIDPRLLAVFDATANEWRVAAGTYKIMLGQSAAEIVVETTLALPEQHMPAGLRAGKDVETANITTN
jgi:beta-glucosidase